MDESDSDEYRAPVPKPKPKIRHIIADPDQKSTLHNSPPTPSRRSNAEQPTQPSAKSDSRRRRHAKQLSVEDETTSAEIAEKPKPKPRTMSSAISAPASSSKHPAAELPSTSAAAKLQMSTETNGADQSQSSKSKKFKKKTRLSQRSQDSPEKSLAAMESGSIAASSGRGDAESALNIKDILQAFQDDIVTVPSTQRSQWQDKMDSTLLFPELDQRFDSSAGWDRRASVPSKWKSAASLIPHDTGAASSNETLAGRSSLKKSIFKRCSIGLNCLSFFTSGILCGLLIWKAVFAMSQMLASSTFDLSPFFWILFWTVTTVLLLVTILGFLNRNVCYSNLIGSSLLRFIPCLLIFSTYYLSKAFDLQRHECQQYLDMGAGNLTNVRPTYTCDASVAGRTWNDLNYWKISLDIFPALGTITVYTFFHFKIHRQRLSGSAVTLSTNIETA